MLAYLSLTVHQYILPDIRPHNNQKDDLLDYNKDSQFLGIRSHILGTKNLKYQYKTLDNDPYILGKNSSHYLYMEIQLDKI